MTKERLITSVCTLLAVGPLFTIISFQYVLVASLVAVIGLVIVKINALRRNRWRVHMDGKVEPNFEHVANTFRHLLERQDERGGAFSVYYKGEPVVDLWGGYADFESYRLRKADSTSLFYSVTKALTAIVIAVLVDRGLLDYDKPVAQYWPEFAENGKKDITLKMLLCHRGGIMAIREKHKLSLIRDNPEKMSALLESETPQWEPGTAQGYHTLTFGLYADQLVRRVDPKHRSLTQFFNDEIAIPFDIDITIGERREQFHRACRETRFAFSWKSFFTVSIPTALHFVPGAIYSFFTWGKIYLTYHIGNPSDWLPRRLNDPSFREIPSPASHGVGTARALGKLLNILACGGEYQGKRLLSKERIDYLNTVLSDDWDRTVLRHITYGPGLTIIKVKDPAGKERTIFGHWGAGGQMAFVDPEYHLSWAYLTNYCNVLHGFIVDARYTQLEKAMYKCVYELNKNK